LPAREGRYSPCNRVNNRPAAHNRFSLGSGDAEIAAITLDIQMMPGARWLELLCKHIPDRHEHPVRYVGLNSDRARGERAKPLKAQQPAHSNASLPCQGHLGAATRATLHRR